MSENLPPSPVNSVSAPRKIGGGRLSVGWRAGSAAPAALTVSPGRDALEKRERRLKRKSMLDGGPGSPAPSLASAKTARSMPPPTATTVLDGEQLTELYTNCIKLCTDNKINQKNSWDLTLIDYIQDVVGFRHGEMTNFQMASCTLDASVKIYSYRVDSVHAETFKVINGLSRAGGRGPAATDDDDNGRGDDGDDAGTAYGGNDNDNGDDTARPAAAAAKKKRHHTVNTIETKLENLNVKQFDLEFDVDPLFRKTSASFDEGGARGLLLNHLYTHRGGELLFDSTETVGACAPAAAVTSTAPSPLVDVSAFQALFSLETASLSVVTSWWHRVKLTRCWLFF